MKNIVALILAVCTAALPAAAASSGGSTSSGGGLTSPVGVVDGGTGATTAADARTNLSAAKSGANTDITSLGSLSTPLSVGQGGTGTATLTSGSYVVGNGTSAPTLKTPSQVRTDIGAAASGANTDITSLGSLSTPLSVGQGGTGAASFTSGRYLKGNGTGAFSTQAAPIPITDGGIGATSLTGDGVAVVNSGGTALTTVAPGTSGNVLTSNGTSWTSAAASGGSGASLSKRWQRWSVTSLSATSFNAFGVGVVSHDGTTATAAPDSSGTYLNSASSGSSAALAGWECGNNWARFDQGPLDYTFHIKTGAAGDITNCRIFVGMCATGSLATTSDTPGASGSVGCGVSYFTTPDNTAFWRTRTFNGAADTAFTTTVAIAAATDYTFRIVYTPATDVKFYINGTLVRTETATLPSGSGSNANVVVVEKALEAAVKNIKCDVVHAEAP